MHHFSIASLTVLALIPPVFTSLSPPPQPYPSQQDTTLRPINVVDYEESMGLQRRELNNLPAMVPQNHTHLVYGRPEGNGQILLANMTLHAQDGLPIVLLERLNVSVDCRDEEGTLALTFGSEEAFEYAREQWGYVNKANDGRFLLIANHDGCGPDDQRQSYIVSNITDNTASLTKFLAAAAAPWSEVAASYDATIGQGGTSPHASRLRRHVWDVMKGNDDHNFTSVSFNIGAGQQDQRSNIYTSPDSSFALDCTNCFIAGSFEVQGSISVKDYVLQDLIVTASPSSVFAALELEATIDATETPQSLSFDHTIISQPITGAGIEIPGIMKLGAFLDYSLSADCTFSGSASASFGVDARLPDSALIKADYQNHGASSASGFDSTELTPMFHLNNASASMTLSATSKPAIKFQFKLEEIGNVDVAVTVNLPEASVTLSAVFDENGVCGNDAGASKMGIKVDSEATIEVDLAIDASVGHYDAPWSTPLWSSSKPLPSKCFPVSVPGLESSPSTTSIPPVSATPFVSANVSGILPSPTPNRRLGRRWALHSFPLFAASTGTTSKFAQLSNSSSPDGRLILDVLSRLGLGLLPTPTTSFTSSSTESSSIENMITSTELGTVSDSTTVTSSMASNTDTFITVSSTVSKDLEITSTSTSAAVPVSSHMEVPPKYASQSSSTLLSTTSSRLKETTPTTLNSSKAKTSETGASTLPSTILSSSADTTTSSGLRSSTLLSSSVSKSSLSTKIDTTATSSISVPSKSTSESYPHVSTSRSTTKSQPQLTSSIATPSHTHKSEPLDHKSTHSSSTPQTHLIDTKTTQPPPSSTEAAQKSHTTSAPTESSPEPIIAKHAAATLKKSHGPQGHSVCTQKGKQSC